MIINPNRIRIYVPHCIVGGMNRFMNYVTTTWEPDKSIHYVEIQINSIGDW